MWLVTISYKCKVQFSLFILIVILFFFCLCVFVHGVFDWYVQLVLGFVSFWKYTGYIWIILSIRGFMWGCSKMMLSFLYWHHLSFLGNQFARKLYIWLKKNCVSEITVEVGYPLVVLDASLRNLRVFPCNRDGWCTYSFPAMYAASLF